ncbi:MAG: hypothetical protein GY769_18480 [bacterium]|nr:hypothetical protein [bacterium]
MTASDRGPELEVEKVDYVLDLLRQEQSELRQTRWQRLLYGLQAVSTFGFVLALVVLLGAMWLGGGTEIGEEIGAWAAVAFAGFTLAALLLLLVNLLVMRRYRDRLRLLRRFGLKGVVDSSWRTAPTGIALGSVWSSIGFLLGAIWILVGAAAVVGGLLIPGTAEDKFGTVFKVFLGTAPGMLLVAFYMLRRAHKRNARLTDLNLFGNLLKQRKAAAQEASHDAIEWSPGLRRQLEQIERGRIRRQRSEAIQESFTARPSDSYGVIRSSKSLLAATQLPSEAVIDSETLIQQLAKEPRPEDAEQDGELWKLADLEAGIEVHYEINDDDRFVKVRDVVDTTPSDG